MMKRMAYWASMARDVNRFPVFLLLCELAAPALLCTEYVANAEIVNALVAAGLDVTAVNRRGTTPLHTAALSARARGSPSRLTEFNVAAWGSGATVRDSGDTVDFAAALSAACAALLLLSARGVVCE